MRGDSEMMFGILPRSSSFFASSCWLLRSALPSAIWVRTIARSRSLSQGFVHKIARPEFHRLDREIDRRPGRHDDDRQSVVESPESAE